MKTFYKSLFFGLVEITEDQKEKLINRMKSGITTMSGAKRQDYIDSRFSVK